MTIVDFILLAAFGFICYYIGKARMLHDIVNEAVAFGQEEAKDAKNALLTSGELFIEKINDCYYAYVEQIFVEQATTFDELFAKLKQNKLIGTFTVKEELDTLSTDEQVSMARALKSTFDAIELK